MLEKLSPRQQDVMDFMVSFYEANGGVFPSLREIGAEMGITSTNGVSCHLESLRRKGWLRGRDGKVRARGIFMTVAAQREYGIFRSRLDNTILRRIMEYIEEFPESVASDIQRCETPLEGAAQVINDIEDIMELEY